MNCLRGSPLIAAVLGWVLFFPLAVQSNASELRPYLPPIQQQAPPMEQRQLTVPAPKAVKPANPLETYYQKFERDTANLSQAQRDKLIDAFSTQLDSARRNKKWEEVTYYSRLIDILSKRR